MEDALKRYEAPVDYLLQMVEGLVPVGMCDQPLLQQREQVIEYWRSLYKFTTLTNIQKRRVRHGYKLRNINHIRVLYK